MKTIFGEYGRTVLAALLCISMFVILNQLTDTSGNRGILAIMRTRAEIKMPVYHTFTDTDTVGEIVSARPPVVSFQAGEWYAQEAVPLLAGVRVYLPQENLTVAANTAGACRTSVLSITDEDGSEVRQVYQRSNGTAVFAREGVYTMRIRVRDVQNRETIQTVMFAINKRE